MHEKCYSYCCRRDSTTAPSSSFSWSSLLLVALVGASSLRFSSWLPFVIPLGVAPAAVRTYVPAGYAYDGENTRFDNTAWTYGTDYALAAVMSCIARACATACADRASGLRRYASGLLICYAASTLAGGWAHQHYAGVEMLNTSRFRILWTVTVGNVAFASCYMGLIGREVQRAFGVGGAVPLGPW